MESLSDGLYLSVGLSLSLSLFRSVSVRLFLSLCLIIKVEAVKRELWCGKPVVFQYLKKHAFLTNSLYFFCADGVAFCSDYRPPPHSPCHNRSLHFFFIYVINTDSLGLIHTLVSPELTFSQSYAIWGFEYK